MDHVGIVVDDLAAATDAARQESSSSWPRRSAKRM